MRLLFFIFLLLMCGSISFTTFAQKVINKPCEEIEKEQEYLFVFIEATRYALMGNVTEAIKLYQACIRNCPEQGASYYQLSLLYQRNGDNQRALDYARLAWVRDKENEWFGYQLATLYQSQGIFDSVVYVYSYIEKNARLSSEELYNLGIMYYSLDKHAESLHYFGQLITQGFYDERIVYYTNDMFRRMNMQDKAFEILELGLIRFPENVDFRRLKAEQLTIDKRFDEAEALFDTLMLSYAHQYDVVLSYSEFLYRCGRFSNSFESYRSVIVDSTIPLDVKVEALYQFVPRTHQLSTEGFRVDSLVKLLVMQYPEHIGLRVVSAEIHNAIGDYLQMAIDLKFLAAKRPAEAKFSENIVYVENFLGNYDSVLFYGLKHRERFESGLQLNMILSHALSRKGLHADAIDLLDSTLSLADTKSLKSLVHSAFGDTYYAGGNVALSASHFEKAIRYDAANDIARNNYSYYLSIEGTNLRKALRLSRSVIKRNPTNSTYLDTYAWVLYKLGRRRTALQYIEMAISFNGSTNAEILDHYAEILYSLSRVQDAVSIWQSILLLPGNHESISTKLNRL